MRIRILIFTLSLFFLFSLSCKLDTGTKVFVAEEVEQHDELQEVRDAGVLKAVVDYNSTNYFVYRGRPMGFQYELLKAFTNDLGVSLEIIVRNNLSDTFRDLYEGKVNLVAKNLTITKGRSKLIDFTYPLAFTRQVLVQRKPVGWEQMEQEEIDEKIIRNQLDLAGKVVHVQKNTVYAKRLRSLSDEIGAEIEIVEDTVYGVEQLVSLVAKGDIEYTVCDENVALVNQTYYPFLDIATPVSFPQNLAWATRKGSDKLKDYVDNWIKNFRDTKEYVRIYRKYFLNSRSLVIANSTFNSNNGGKVSDFDDVIKDESSKRDMDWRLIAAIIYQESRFDPYIESWAGAAGLMQLMPETAERWKVEDVYDPRQNITGGIKMLRWLDRYFMQEMPEDGERIKFVLASYNVGLGHVLDARRLARKYGKNHNRWDGNVDFYLLNKSASKYYKDPLVRWGYCRGEEPYKYVTEVLERYSHYLNLFEA
jgi:membrane-bound lytic murein transglycosylase F